MVAQLKASGQEMMNNWVSALFEVCVIRARLHLGYPAPPESDVTYVYLQECSSPLKPSLALLQFCGALWLETLQIRFIFLFYDQLKIRYNISKINPDDSCDWISLGGFYWPLLTLCAEAFCLSWAVYYIFGANFSSVDLFLVWGRETFPFHSCCLVETRAACRPVTTQPRTVAFSVPDIRWLIWYTRH